MPARRKAASRAIKVATMSAGVTGSYLGYLAQRLFLSDDAREAKLKATHQSAARRVSDGMLEMKGPLMKLGQTLSLYTEALPAEALGELTRLQMSAPGMHPSLVRAQFKGSLGRDPEDVFAEWDPTPFAAASLGQVHHARTRDGKRVAVKIQYPGIRDAIQGDFQWFRAAALPARLSNHFPARLIDELQEQLIAETDYKREAANAELFAKALAPLKFVDVPEIHRRLSSEKVLTMSHVEGEHLDAFLAKKPSQRLRDLVGARLFELFYHQVFRMEALHADPHWGNYLFRGDGTFGLVDFGCVKYMPAPFVENLRHVFLYTGPRDSDEFKRLMQERYVASGTKLSAAAQRSLARFSQRFYLQVYPPDAAKGGRPFDFSDPAFLKAYMIEATGLTRSKAALPEYMLLARAEIGLYQTLHRLRARVATTRIVRHCITDAAR
jgi:predicted unusual protein kinase regulating ubiquinone biosynthesis (AarF/ABC1/UbiB family)